MKVMSGVLIGIVLLSSGCQKRDANVGSHDSTPAGAISAPKPPPVAAVAKKGYDGPFGLAMGILPAELNQAFGFKNTSDRPSQFVGVPPKPVPDFESYFVTATPVEGICILGAIQSLSVVNDSGDQLKQRVDSVAEMLAVKYGEHTEKMDFGSQERYRRNSEYWMMYLMKDAVTYAYSWQTGKKNKSLPNGIDHIEVFASASSLNAGAVIIKYYFQNEKRCAAEKRTQKAENL